MKYKQSHTRLIRILLCCLISVWGACKAPEDSTKSIESYEDATPPSVVSITPADSSHTIRGTNFMIEFSENMDSDSLIVNTTDDSCTGTIQVSDNNFSTCIQMASNSTADSDNKTFAIQPASNMERGQTYDLRITTGVKDVSGVSLENGFSTNIGVTISSVVQVAAGGYHTCAVLDDGPIQCWGYGRHGQLGNDSTSDQPSSVPVSGILTAGQIVTGFYHSCALLTDKKVQCWGAADYGQLGNGDASSDQAVPVAVSGISTATQVTAGWAHSCALLEDRTVWCWGNNNTGQLGNGEFNDGASPVSTPVQVSDIDNAIAVEAGEFHTCALLTDKTVKCWGFGESGQLGNGSTTSSATPVPVNSITTAAGISAGYAHTCVLLEDGTVKCWGSGKYGRLGNGSGVDSLTPVSASGIANGEQISTFNSHTCVRLADGTVKCWGWGEHGQLGNNDTSDQETPVAVQGIITAIEISAGSRHTCALLQNYDLKCWGYGVMMQLGNGTTSDQSVPTIVDDL